MGGLVINTKEHVFTILRNIHNRVAQHHGPLQAWLEQGTHKDVPTDVVAILRIRLVGAAAEIEPQDVVEIVEADDGPPD